MRGLCLCSCSEEYVQMYVDHLLNGSMGKLYDGFARGFFNCLDRNILSLFRPDELQLVMLGHEDKLDVGLLQEVRRGSSVPCELFLFGLSCSTAAVH